MKYGQHDNNHYNKVSPIDLLNDKCTFLSKSASCV